jgi:hypothetical protein
MTRPWSRVVSAVLALGLTVGACGGDGDDPDDAAGSAATSTTAAPGAGTTEESTTTTTTTTSAAATDEPAGGIVLEIVGGNAVGGVRREKVKQGSEVRLRITSDVADELHVHTYDLTVDVEPGEPAELVFEATIPGIHEIELEKRRKKVLELEVSP